MAEKNMYKEYAFNGQWLPSIDPMKIGEHNFAELENFRYTDGSIEQIEGYSKINSTALTTYLKGRSGIQLRTPYTTKSYLLLQEYNTDLSASQILYNKTAIPNQGDFEVSALHTDASGASLGRFHKFPNFHVGYCNEQEACIWAGDEMRVAAFIRISAISGLTLTTPVIFTEEINNELSSSGNTVQISGSNLKFLAGSTRPLKGAKFYVSSANASTSTLTCKYWSGSAWTSVSNPSDGTSVGGKALAQTGIFSFDSTVSVAKVAYLEGMLLYFYLFELSAGDATLYHVTNDAPFQNIVDVWDGVFRRCVKFQVTRSGVHEDYTLEVNQTSTQDYPIAALIGGLTSSDEIILMFEERMTALKWEMIANLVNKNASAVTIKYWNGSALTTVGTVTDGTSASSKTLNQSGVMSWNDPGETNEKIRTLYGVTGYAYQITFSATLTDKSYSETGTHTGADNQSILTDSSASWQINELIGKIVYNETDKSSGIITSNTATTVKATLSGGTDNDWDTNDAYSISSYSGSQHDGTSINILMGIPAQKTMRPYRFPFMYQNRPMLCGDIVGKEGHKVDYGMANANDVHNGDDSSDLGQSLYFGSSGDLTCAIGLYNRFGSNVLDTALFFKATSTYLLNGTGPDDFVIYKVSSNYGCPASMTVVAVEVGYEMSGEESAKRNIAIWLSYQGPLLFDAAVIIPIPGVEQYFDSRKSICVNFDAIENSRAWYDPKFAEYNLLMPSGSGQITCNLWLVYDLKRKRWYKNNTNDAEYPQFAIQAESEGGKKYIYGCIDTGYLMRLENGTTWDGTTIQHKVKSADILPFNSAWRQSRINQFKLISQIPDFEEQAITVSITISINHYKDGEQIPEALTALTIAKTDFMQDENIVTEGDEEIVTSAGDIIVADWYDKKRYTTKTQACSFLGLSHQFEFIQNSDSYSYVANFGKTFLGWGFLYNAERIDI